MKRLPLLLTLLITAASFLPSVQAQTAGAVYPGSNFGPIPDGVSSRPLAYGAPRDIRFNVQNRTGSIDTVGVEFRASHNYVGDLKVQLIAPDGRSHLLFERTGITTDSASDAGYPSGLSESNRYQFGDDSGQLVGTNWWTAADVNGIIGEEPLFSTVISGGPGVSEPATKTSMNDTFRGEQPNGTWILRFEDGWIDATGVVTSAELIITDPGELVLDTDSGLTPVLRLAEDSPALDASIATDVSFFDGRGEGFRRTEELERPNAPGSNGTDIGAFKLRGPILFRSRFESD